MDALIDSHTFLWLVADPTLLSPVARAFVADPNRRLNLSVASGWELAIKHGLGKLPLTIPLSELLLLAPARAMVGWLDVRPAHMLRVAGLPQHHRDPFDRLIVAQALVEQVPIVSADVALDAYGVGRIW